MPEAVTPARQMNTELTEKSITRFARGTQTHKFLWLNRPYEEYETILLLMLPNQCPYWLHPVF